MSEEQDKKVLEELLLGMHEFSEASEQTVKDLIVAGEVVDVVAEFTVNGSYAQRHLALGKMMTCMHCGTRRHENAELPCCNPVYTSPKPAGRDAQGKLTGGPTLRQIFGADLSLRPKKQPGHAKHRGKYALQLHELVKKFGAMEGSPAEWSEEAMAEMDATQIEIETLLPFHRGERFYNTSPATIEMKMLQLSDVPAFAERVQLRRRGQCGVPHR